MNNSDLRSLRDLAVARIEIATFFDYHGQPLRTFQPTREWRRALKKVDRTLAKRGVIVSALPQPRPPQEITFDEAYDKLKATAEVGFDIYKEFIGG